MRRATMSRVQGKRFGLLIVGTVSFVTFAEMTMDGWIGLALSLATMRAYWYLYGDQ